MGKATAWRCAKESLGTSMKILLFENNYSSNLFRGALAHAFPGDRVVGISEYRGRSDVWIGSYLYDDSYDGDCGLDDASLHDIVSRDRSLNQMREQRAMRIVKRYWNGLEKLFAHEGFDLVVSVALDRYGEDVLFRMAQENGVPIMAPCGSFLENYVWFTERGERQPIGRVVGNEEIDRVISELTRDDYLPASECLNVRTNHKNIKKYYYRRMLVERVYYPIKKLLDRDPDNHQYNSYLVKGHSFREYYNRSLDDIFVHSADLVIDKENTVYMPLHFTPEASTSYWCDEVVQKGYLNYVLSIVEGSDPSVTFLVKEHPAMYGKRLLGFYDELKKRTNVALVHPMDRSNELLNMVDNVLVDTGTVGVEALLRGKRVISLSDNYYSDLHPNIVRSGSVTREVLTNPLVEYDSRRFVGDLLGDYCIGDYFSGRGQEACSIEELAQNFLAFRDSHGL